MMRNVFTASVVGDVKLLKSIVHSVVGNSATNFDLNAFDEFGYSPLHYAVIHNHVSFAAALLDFGAIANPACAKTSRRTPLFYGVASCNSKMVQLLIANGGEVKARDLSGMSPLHMIVCNGEGAKDSPHIIQVISKGLGGGRASVLDAADGGGDSTLHACAVKGLPRMIQALCLEGAKVNVERPLDNRTPLHLACAKPFSQTPTKAQGEKDPQMFNVEIIRNLVAAGAHLNKPISTHGFLSLYVLVAGEHSQLLVPNPNPNKDSSPTKSPSKKKDDDAPPSMVLNEQWFFSVFMGVKELITRGAKVSNTLMTQLPAGMSEVSERSEL